MPGFEKTNSQNDQLTARIQKAISLLMEMTVAANYIWAKKLRKYHDYRRNPAIYCAREIVNKFCPWLEKREAEDVSSHVRDGMSVVETAFKSKQFVCASVADAVAKLVHEGVSLKAACDWQSAVMRHKKAVIIDNREYRFEGLMIHHNCDPVFYKKRMYSLAKFFAKIDEEKINLARNGIEVFLYMENMISSFNSSIANAREKS